MEFFDFLRYRGRTAFRLWSKNPVFSWTHFEIPLDGKEGGRRLMMTIPLHAASGREQMEF